MGLELYTKSQKRRLQKFQWSEDVALWMQPQLSLTKKALRETYSTIYINKSDDARVLLFFLPKTRAHLLISLQTKKQTKE